MISAMAPASALTYGMAPAMTSGAGSWYIPHSLAQPLNITPEHFSSHSSSDPLQLQWGILTDATGLSMRRGYYRLLSFSTGPHKVGDLGTFLTNTVVNVPDLLARGLVSH